MNTIQEQILFGYAVREAAYEVGLLAEKPSSLKEGTQGFADAWIEEFERQNNKNNMEQIKVGDIVRVSEDAPKMYLNSKNNLFKYHVCKVEEVDGDSAKIRYTDIGVDSQLAIPTKYLIKVNTEPKYSKGDKVRISCAYDDGEIWDKVMHGRIATVKSSYRSTENIIMYKFDECIRDFSEHWLEPYTEPEEPTIKVGDRVRIKPDVAKCLPSLLEPFKHLPFEVMAVGDGFITAECYGRYVYLPSPQFELIQPKEQPKESFDGISEETASGLADATKADAEMSEETANKLSDMIEARRRTMRIIEDSFDWQRYEADLARDIAMKIVNKHMDDSPEMVGAYAVKVAKEVVENLKNIEQ